VGAGTGLGDGENAGGQNKRLVARMAERWDYAVGIPPLKQWPSSHARQSRERQEHCHFLPCDQLRQLQRPCRPGHLTGCFFDLGLEVSAHSKACGNFLGDSAFASAWHGLSEGGVVVGCVIVLIRDQFVRNRHWQNRRGLGDACFFVFVDVPTTATTPDTAGVVLSWSWTSRSNLPLVVVGRGWEPTIVRLGRVNRAVIVIVPGLCGLAWGRVEVEGLRLLP